MELATVLKQSSQSLLVLRWHFLSLKNLEENKKALNVTLSIQWIKDVQPDRRKFNLETIFQTWASNHKNAGEGRLTCEVLTVSEDGSVVQLSIKPPPGVW